MIPDSRRLFAKIERSRAAGYVALFFICFTIGYVSAVVFTLWRAFL